jgi:hypothetical protein
MYDPSPYRFAFVMEQTLGHVTHYRNLRATIDSDVEVSPTWLPLAFEPSGPLEALPVITTNWSARASLRASRMLAARHAAQSFDALFFHTQVTTLLSTGLMRVVPTVVSLDATPENYDAVGAAYGHGRGGRSAEAAKRTLNRRPLLAARALITWCDWARRSLIADYGVPAERITVIPPGVPLECWPKPGARPAEGPVRLLFVGGDFERKGGPDLLQALPLLPAATELHLVTKAAVAPAPRVHVYRDLAANSEELKCLYAQADLFVLPTRADCFPVAIQEAMAAGLPVVAADVGAVGEAVQHGETGLLVRPCDVTGLAQAISALTVDPHLRQAMGRQGRVEAERRFDSAANARQILGIMKRLAEQPMPQALPAYER